MSKTDSSTSAEETEEERAERGCLEVRLIAQGALPFPRGLEPNAERRLVHAVRLLRRRRLVDMLALVVARHLAARRTNVPELLHYVEKRL